MRTIIFKDLNGEQILDMVDSSIPFILITGFRPHSAREWCTTDIYLDSKEKLENIQARDLTVDILTDKETVERIFKRAQFNQLALWQFSKRVPSTLKIDELPSETTDKILTQNGLVNRIWVNYEFVELSSVDEKYIEIIRERYKSNLV
jgi:hypothetical protein